MDYQAYFVLDDDHQAVVVRPKCAGDTFAAEASREVWPALFERIQDAGKPVVIDLSNLNYFGSIILDWISSTAKVAKKSGQTLSICAVTEPGMEVIRLARFDKLWPIHATLEDALGGA